MSFLHLQITGYHRRLLLLLRGRFALNWSFLVGSNLACQVLGMFATIRIARTLAPEGYGAYNLVQTVASIGMIVAGLGFRNVIIRECARHPEKSASLFLVSTLIRSCSLIITAIGLLLCRALGQIDFSIPLVGTAVVLMVGVSIWDLVESITFAHEHMEYSAVINLAGSIVWVLLAWAVPKNCLTPLNVALTFAILQTTEALIYVAVGRRLGYFRGQVQALLWRSLLRQSLPFYWLAIMSSVTSQLPILILAHRSGRAEVGLYNVGWRLVTPMQMLTATALTALYPSLCQTAVGDEQRFLEAVKHALLGLTVLGVTGALSISLLRQEIVALLFGNAYRASADALAFQCWYSALFAIFSFIGVVLAARDRQKWLAALSSAFALVSTPLLWFGSGYGASGLALAALGTAVVNMTYHWVALQRCLPKPLTAAFVVLLAAAFVAGMLVSWAAPQTLPFPWRIAIVMGTVGLLAAGAVSFDIGRQHAPINLRAQ